MSTATFVTNSLLVVRTTAKPKAAICWNCAWELHVSVQDLAGLGGPRGSVALQSEYPFSGSELR